MTNMATMSDSDGALGAGEGLGGSGTASAPSGNNFVQDGGYGPSAPKAEVTPATEESENSKKRHSSNSVVNNHPAWKNKFSRFFSQFSISKSRRLNLSRDSGRKSTLKHAMNVVNRKNISTTIGLENHGNTCFMNAILQCLRHTTLLDEYFSTDQYKLDIKRHNKLNSKKYGSSGEVTEHLAKLFKSLWNGSYTRQVSADFKNIIEKHCCQYRGESQHDAQEFLLFLLNKIHEDLNVATKQRQKDLKVNKVIQTDESLALETLVNQSRHDDSFVYGLFQALYCSSLTCPSCSRQSNTFETFLNLSLPIPQRSQRPVQVTVVYADENPKQVKIGLLFDVIQTIKVLRDTISQETKIPVEQLILVELDQTGFQHTLRDSQPLSDLHVSDELFAIEVTPHPHQTEELISEHGGYITVVVVNKTVSKINAQRFGYIHTLTILADLYYTDFIEEILTTSAMFFRSDAPRKRLLELFRVRVIGGLAGQCYIDDNVTYPMFTPTIERALNAAHKDAGPRHVKLMIEWKPIADHYMRKIIPTCETIQHQSVDQVSYLHSQPFTGTLDQCFTLYTQQEKLGVEDTWLCANCQKQQTGTLKSIKLWSTPDILVIHLKRFRQTGLQRTKLNTLIEFPLRGLDMTRYTASRSNTHLHAHTASLWSAWKQSRRKPHSSQDNFYDLYAVVNHFGNMQGGHYTACCLNNADDHWYSYDDVRVRPVNQDEVVSPNAYILFYRRRTLVSKPPHSANSKPTTPTLAAPGTPTGATLLAGSDTPPIPTNNNNNMQPSKSLDHLNQNGFDLSDSQRDASIHATMRKPRSPAKTVLQSTHSTPQATRQRDLRRSMRSTTHHHTQHATTMTTASPVATSPADVKLFPVSHSADTLETSATHAGLQLAHMATPTRSHTAQAGLANLSFHSLPQTQPYQHGPSREERVVRWGTKRRQHNHAAVAGGGNDSQNTYGTMPIRRRTGSNDGRNNNVSRSTSQLYLGNHHTKPETNVARTPNRTAMSSQKNEDNHAVSTSVTILASPTDLCMKESCV